MIVYHAYFSPRRLNIAHFHRTFSVLRDLSPLSVFAVLSHPSLSGIKKECPRLSGLIFIRGRERREIREARANAVPMSGRLQRITALILLLYALILHYFVGPVRKINKNIE